MSLSASCVRLADVVAKPVAAASAAAPAAAACAPRIQPPRLQQRHRPQQQQPQSQHHHRESQAGNRPQQQQQKQQHPPQQRQRQQHPAQTQQDQHRQRERQVSNRPQQQQQQQQRHQQPVRHPPRSRADARTRPAKPRTLLAWGKTWVRRRVEGSEAAAAAATAALPPRARRAAAWVEVGKAGGRRPPLPAPRNGRALPAIEDFFTRDTELQSFFALHDSHSHHLSDVAKERDKTAAAEKKFLVRLRDELAAAVGKSGAQAADPPREMPAGGEVAAAAAASATAAPAGSGGGDPHAAAAADGIASAGAAGAAVEVREGSSTWWGVVSGRGMLSTVGEQLPTSQAQHDVDRKNATEIRTAFQHIRSVSFRLGIAKELNRTVAKMRAQPGGYVGLQTYRQCILVLSRVSRGSTISEYYEAMRSDQIIPDTEIFELILGVWCKRSVEKVYYYVAEMVQCGLMLSSHRIIDAAIHAVAWCRDLAPSEDHERARMARVQRLLAIAHEANYVTEEAYTPLIRFATTYEEGLNVFRAMVVAEGRDHRGVEVTHKTLNALLQLCVQTASPENAERFFRVMTSCGYPAGAAQWRYLLASYEAAGRPSDVVAVFERLRERNDALRKAAAQDEFAAMQIQPLRPTSQSFDILLRARRDLYAACIGSRHNDVDLRGAVDEEEEKPAVAVSFAKQVEGRTHLRAAEAAFEEAVTEWDHGGAPNLWNTLLEVYVVAQDTSKAVAHLKRMKDSGLPANARCRALYTRLTGEVMAGWDAMGRASDDPTLARFLSSRYKLSSRNAEHLMRSRGALRGRYVKRVLACVAERVEHEGESVVGALTLVTLVRLIGAAGELGLAEGFYQRVRREHAGDKRASASAATAMMGVHTARRDMQKVMEVWRAAMASGATPDGVMCAQLLWGFAKSGVPLAEQGPVLAAMGSAGIALPENAVVALLTSAATPAEAAALFENLRGGSVGVAHTAPVLCALLKTCAKEEDAATAEAFVAEFEAAGVELRGREHIGLMNVYKEVGDLASTRRVLRALDALSLPAEDANPAVMHTILLQAAVRSLRRSLAEADVSASPEPAAGPQEFETESELGALAAASVEAIGVDVTPPLLDTVVQLFLQLRQRRRRAGAAADAEEEEEGEDQLSSVLAAVASQHGVAPSAKGERLLREAAAAAATATATATATDGQEAAPQAGAAKKTAKKRRRGPSVVLRRRRRCQGAEGQAAEGVPAREAGVGKEKVRRQTMLRVSRKRAAKVLRLLRRRMKAVAEDAGAAPGPRRLRMRVTKGRSGAGGGAATSLHV